MCKAGQVQDAYNLAKTDLANMPLSIMAQKEVGWALYYMIKGDAESGNYALLLQHFDELKSLDQITVQTDSMIYENVLFKIGGFLKNFVSPTDMDTPAKLSTIFQKLRDYAFGPSNGYSYLLSCILKYENWQELLDFLDWWDFKNLTQADYTPYVNQNGQKMMTVAERAYIKKAKCLFILKDLGRIEEFLPDLENLMYNHPEMTWPGYCYGKLLISLGSNTEEALKVIVPFARKKANDYWVWQLISDVFAMDQEKQLACLLRAVHCKTQENFLGKVRIKLASIYIQRNQLDYAKHHIDTLTRFYASQGWHLPNEIDSWVHQSWLNTVVANNKDAIDYMTITNNILCEGTEEAIAIVTYVDQNTHRASLIYGKEKRMGQKLRFKVNVGAVLKINYLNDSDGKPKVLSATKVQLPDDLSYAKFVEGTIDKRDDKEFAFLKAGSVRCFIPPVLVKKYNLSNGENVKAMIVYDYDKKKESWNWSCVSIKK